MEIKYSNFREISTGNIARGRLYRSDHPVCNGSQVRDIILQASSAGIMTVINLCDTELSLKSKIISCPWYKKIYENGNVIALNMEQCFDVTDKTFTRKLNESILFMLEHEPPYLVHCEAGIDRTGFFSIILESLMKSSFDEIVKDYMLSYVNSSEYSDEDYKKGSTFIRNIFSKIKGGLITVNDDIKTISLEYTANRIGLNFEEISILIEKLTNENNGKGSDSA
jgi:protein tyrosine/serine phosphatase